MAMAIEEISAMLNQIGLPHHFGPQKEIVAVIPCDNHVDTDGKKQLLLGIRVHGELAQIFEMFMYPAVSELFNNMRGKHADAFFKACMITQIFTRFVQFEFNPRDNLVMPIIEIPLVDGRLTFDQVRFCLAEFVRAIDDNYQFLRRAAKDGVLEIPEKWKQSLGDTPVDWGKS